MSRASSVDLKVGSPVVDKSPDACWPVDGRSRLIFHHVSESVGSFLYRIGLSGYFFPMFLVLDGNASCWGVEFVLSILWIRRPFRHYFRFFNVLIFLGLVDSVLAAADLTLQLVLQLLGAPSRSLRFSSTVDIWISLRTCIMLLQVWLPVERRNASVSDSVDCINTVHQIDSAQLRQLILSILWREFNLSLDTVSTCVQTTMSSCLFFSIESNESMTPFYIVVLTNYKWFNDALTCEARVPAVSSGWNLATSWWGTEGIWSWSH